MTQNDMPLPDNFWIRKARALLVPSPFAAIDPAGEPARQLKLEQYLRDQLRDVETESVRDAAAREQAAADAYESETHVQTGRGREEEPAPVPPLKHPLSAIALPPAYSRVKPEQIGNDFEHFFGSLPTNSTELAKFVGDLWLAVMSATNRARTPLSHVPGCVLMPDHSVLAHRSLTAALHGARLDGEAALLYLHVGPVQSFIKAARRTHDLWTSSFTVAFLTYCGAEKVAQLIGPDALVFPDLLQLPLSRKRLFGQDTSKESLTHSSLANKLLAVVPLQQTEEIARQSTLAIHREWKEMACAAKNALTDAWQSTSDSQSPDFSKPWEQWDEQIDSHLEIDVVVQPWPQDAAKLTAFIKECGLELPFLLPTEVTDPLRLDPNQRVGAFYGCLFDHSHRLMTAHRHALTPQGTKGDSRPKCVQCVRREQMGPIASHGSGQQRLSQMFFTKLSQALQQQAGGCQKQADDRLSLQLAAGEGLCAVCLVKRLLPRVYYGSTKAQLDIHWNNRSDRRWLQFPSVSTLATAPVRFALAAKLSGEWEGLTSEDREKLRAQIGDWIKPIGELCKPENLNFTHPGNLLPAFRKWESDQTLGDILKVDGSWLYQEFYVFETVWRSHFPDQTPKEEERNSISKSLCEASRALGSIVAAMDCRPSTYLAVLCADVDKMGQWLTGREAPLWKDIADTGLLPGVPEDKKRPLYPALGAELSRRLGRLATTTFLDIVETKCLGRVVYSGGDDLLAFLPLQTALHCLKLLNQAIRQETHLGSKVTLSAGLHIMHWRDPLSRAIESARDAEQTAKKRDDKQRHLGQQGGNCFVISLHKRSGTSALFKLPWVLKTQLAAPTSTIDELLKLLDHGFQDKSGSAAREEERQSGGAQAAYELERELLPLVAGSEDSPPSELVLDALFDRARTLCGFERNQPWPGQGLLEEGVQELKESFSGKDLSEEVRKLHSRNLKRFVDVLLFVRFLQREEHGLRTKALLDQLDLEEES